MIYSLLFAVLLPAAAMAAGEAPPAEPMQIEADHLEIDHGNGEAVFAGHVKLTRGAFVLYADRLTAFYGEEKGKMGFKSGRAIGNVRFDEEERHGRADEVLFDYDSGTVTLLGNAELNQPGGRVSGDSIEYDLNSGDTKVRQGESGRVKVRIDQELVAPADAGAQAP